MNIWIEYGAMDTSGRLLYNNLRMYGKPLNSYLDQLLTWLIFLISFFNKFISWFFIFHDNFWSQ